MVSRKQIISHSILSWKIISVKILLWRNLQVRPASLAIIIKWFHMITWDIVMVSLLRITKRTRDTSIWVGEKKCNYQINSDQSGLKNKGITCCLNYLFWILPLLSQLSSTTEKLRGKEQLSTKKIVTSKNYFLICLHIFRFL